MKFLAVLLGFKRKNELRFSRNGRTTIAEHQRETLVKVGRAQFKKLKDLGLTIPVALS